MSCAFVFNVSAGFVALRLVNIPLFLCIRRTTTCFVMVAEFFVLGKVAGRETVCVARASQPASPQLHAALTLPRVVHVRHPRVHYGLQLCHHADWGGRGPRRLLHVVSEPRRLHVCRAQQHPHSAVPHAGKWLAAAAAHAMGLVLLPLRRVHPGHDHECCLRRHLERRRLGSAMPR